MRKFIDYLILLVVSLYFFRDILINPGFPLGADAVTLVGYPSYQALNSLWYSSWEGMGFPGTVGQIIPLHILITFSFLVFNSTIGLTIILLITYLCSGIAMYSLTHYWFKDRNIALISALLYMLGRSYLDQIIQGHYTVMLAYSLFPLIPLTWSQMIRSRGLKEIIFASLIFSLYGLNAHPSIVYLSIFFLIPFFIWDLLTFKSGNNHVSYSKLLITLSAFSVLLLALSSISIMPAFLGKVISPSITDRPISLLIGSIYKTSAPSIFSAITLEGIEARAYFPKIAYGTLLTLLPILSFSAMMFRRDKYVIALTIVALFYVAFSAGPFGIYSPIYLWAIDNIPYLSGVRVPSRGLLFINFCYAILAAVSIRSIYEFIKSREINKSNYRFMSKGYISIATATLILMVTLLPQWPALKFGVQSFQIPSDYANSFEYTRGKSGDFTVMNIPLQGGNGWIDPINPEKEPGWSSTWDYGIWSPGIHGKTVMAFREWYPYSRYFLDNARLLFLNLKLDNFMKYIGQLNVKYITSLPNAAENEKAILSKQKGIKEVYKSGDAAVFLNEYWTPAIFTTPKYAVEVGRLNIFPYIGNLDTSEYLRDITYAPILKKTSDIKSLIRGSNTLIFSGGDFSDLIFSSAEQNKRGLFIDASNHISDTKWSTSSVLLSLGYDVASSSWLYARTMSPMASLSIPLNLDSSGSHEIWIRFFKSKDAGRFSFTLDEEIEVIVNQDATQYVSGFAWIKVTEADLSQGEHSLKITNLTSKETSIDQIAIIKSSVIQSETEEIKGLLQNKKIAFLLRYDDFSTEWQRKSDSEHDKQYLESPGDEGTLNFTIDVPSSRFYRMAIRGGYLSKSSSNKIKLSLGGRDSQDSFKFDDFTLSNDATNPIDSFQWRYVNEFLYLDSGHNTISFKLEDRIRLDTIALFSVDGIKDKTQLEDILTFNSNSVPVKLEYEKIDPSHYEAHVDAGVPFILNFSDAYHPKWRAYIDGNEIKPMLANGFFNAFVIDKTGEYDITIKFPSQSFVSNGAWISGISLFICSLYLLYLAIKSLIHNKLYLFLMRKQ